MPSSSVGKVPLRNLRYERLAKPNGILSQIYNVTKTQELLLTPPLLTADYVIPVVHYLEIQAIIRYTVKGGGGQE